MRGLICGCLGHYAAKGAKDLILPVTEKVSRLMSFCAPGRYNLMCGPQSFPQKSRGKSLKCESSRTWEPGLSTGRLRPMGIA
jgi:hypothetical protein